jgi:phage gp37-like protein
VVQSSITPIVKTYLPRMSDDVLSTLIAQLPAVSVTGPRATGKTTTARRHAATVVRLDREAEAPRFAPIRMWLCAACRNHVDRQVIP